LAVLLFLFLVALGLPLLAGGRGGLGVFMGPTVGFLLGFPVAAFVTGYFSAQWRGSAPVVTTVLAAILGGVVVLYIFGIVGFAMVTGQTLAQATSIMWVFVPGDVVKAGLAGIITESVLRLRPGLAAQG
jgi:biotin transport system substrate-specific component